MKRIEELGRHMGDEQEALAESTADLGRARRALLRVAHGTRAPRPQRRVAIAALAVVGLSLAVAAFWLVRLRSIPPLGFRIVGSENASTGDWLAAPERAPLEILFSDGTRIVMAPRARGRVASVHASGADIVMESGRAEFMVFPRSGARWQVVLGPYTLRVTGTRFDVDWEPKTERLELVLREGAVMISGCGLAPERRVQPGDRLVASCRNGRAQTANDETQTDDELGGDPASPRSSSPLLADAAPADSAPSDPHADRQRNAAVWHDLLQRGRYKEAFAAAESEGFEGACRGASAAELLSLGNAARLSGRADRAAFAYDLLRRRSPSDGRAALAAFELARIAFDLRGDYATAARWFRIYMKEQPGGGLAREAHGRLIEALQRAGDVAGARAEAERYLRSYPGGPHREAAQRLVGAKAAGDAEDAGRR